MASGAAPKHVFVTGQPGVGKSTLIAAVLERLTASGAVPRARLQGFWTEEARSGSGERIGFDIVTWEPGSGASKRGAMARVGAAPRGAPAVGKYAVDVAAIERLALPVLQLPAAGARPQLVVVDEVGKMELCCGAFFPAVWALLGAGPLLFSSVPTPRYGRTIAEVERLKARPDVEVVTVTKANRDALVGELTQLLAERAAALQ